MNQPPPPIETVADLETAARSHATNAESTEDEWQWILTCAGRLAKKPGCRHQDTALSLLINVLASELPESAAGWHPHVDTLALSLHPDTDEPRICRAVAVVLRAWEDRPEPPAGPPPSLEEVRAVMAGTRKSADER